MPEREENLRSSVPHVSFRFFLGKIKEAPESTQRNKELLAEEIGRKLCVTL